MSGSGLGVNRPNVARVDIGRVQHPLFNRLWSHARVSWLLNERSTIPYDQVHGAVGAVNGNPVFADHSHIGPCIDADGTGDYLSFTHHAGGYTGGITFMCVGQIDTVGTSFLISANSADAGNTFLLLNDGGLVLLINNDGLVNSSNFLLPTTGVPYFMAGTANGTSCHLILRRLDTGQVTESTGTYTLETTSRSAVRFCSRGGGGNNFDGKMACGYVGNIALVPAELRAWAENPFGLWREDEVYSRPNRVAAGGTTHATSGVLAGQGAVLDGTAAHIAIHGTTGVLAGQGAALDGTATNYTVHATSGVLAGPGAVLDGTAANFSIHATSGDLIGPGATLDGTSAVVRIHATEGDLVGPGAVVDGEATHAADGVHPTTGTLVGPGAALAGSAARMRAHATDGVLVGAGALLDGTAAIAAEHVTSGDLVGQGSVLDGSAALPNNVSAGGWISTRRGEIDAAQRQTLEKTETQPVSDPFRDIDWTLVQRRLEASVARDRQTKRNNQMMLLLMAA